MVCDREQWYEIAKNQNLARNLPTPNVFSSNLEELENRSLRELETCHPSPPRGVTTIKSHKWGGVTFVSPFNPFQGLAPR